MVSDKPWGPISESDYDLDPWYEACLIKPARSRYHAKDQAKLPVREPDGTLNRNGVHAAAAVLAGARAGVDASAQDRRKAARALIRLYKELEEDPPESLVELAERRES